MGVKDVYIQLAPNGHITRVLSHDGKYDKLIINNPWLVSNPAWIGASRFLVGMACLFALCGAIAGPGADPGYCYHPYHDRDGNSPARSGRFWASHLERLFNARRCL